MVRGRPALAVLVAVAIAACAACGVSGTPPPTSNPSPIANGASPKPTAGIDPEATNSPGSSSPAPTPLDSPDPTPVSVPPKPTGVLFDESRVGDDAPTTVITQTVQWGAPTSEGIEIRVFGVTECIAKPADPSPDTRGPCLAEDTPLPASVRTLLATAPASEGVVSWTWTGTFDCEIGLAYDPGGPAYHAVVLAAYGASGHSIFAIAEAGEWWQPDPEEIVC